MDLSQPGTVLGQLRPDLGRLDPDVRQPALVFSPHPILLAKDQELVYARFLPNETILEYLQRTGILGRMARQPFVLAVDGRRLPRTLWAHCRPKSGTLINLYAVVRGGGGGGKKNPIATIAMIALSVYAPAAGASLYGAGTVGAAIVSGGIMVVGGMVINSVFPPPRPDLARAQNLGGGDSPTYAIGGGSNRMRRYEPMPKLAGVHRVYPDAGAQPYSEFQGAEQIGFYVFDLGYNDAELTDFKIGETPIGEFTGVEYEISGPDGKLALVPANVDSQAGVELPFALGFVSRTSSPQARSLAVEITGSLFYLGDSGTEQRVATAVLEYRPVGGGAWSALTFAPDTVPASSVVNGVARVPAADYTRGVRKAVTVQPPNMAAQITVTSVSVNTPAGVGQVEWTSKFSDWGAFRWRAPGGNAGPWVAVGGGGQFFLKDATGTMDLLVTVHARVPAEGGATFGPFTIGAAEIAGEFLLLNASREPLRRTFFWHVAEGQYEVRVKKSSPDETNLRATAQIVWSQLRTYQPDLVDYTGRLRVGLKIQASALANGVLQQFSCVARARCEVYAPLGTISTAYESHLWQAGVTPTGYSLNESTAGESIFAARTGPFGASEIVNVCVNQDIFAGEPGADGGWNLAAVISVDRTKSHLFAVFMKRKVTGGGAFWGMTSNGATHAVGVAGGDGNNPYFDADSPANLMPNNDEWYLAIGFMHANGYAGGDLGISGVYNSAGVRVYNGTEFAWANATTLCAHRSYHYYNSTDAVGTECQQMTRPVVMECTAAEATTKIAAILAQGADPLARDWPIRHTSNPAFWYLDALRGKTVNGRRVWGAGLPDTRIDIEGLKLFSTWCVAQGLAFNAVFDQQLSVHDMLSAIALMGRGTPTMQTGKHGVLWDAPDLPTTAVFGMHNIVAGSFSIDYAAGDLADVIEASFVNPDLNWQRDFVRALVPGALSEARVRRVDLFGCTNKAQAGQQANLYAAANFYRPRRYKWRADWEQMSCPRGDVALLGHDLLQLLSGRFIEGGSANLLKLPRAVPLYAAGAFITIRKPDGTFATYGVEAGAGESDTLTPSAALPFNPWADPEGYPPYDYRWHYGPASTTGRKVKIADFKPVSERLVDVTAVDEDPAYYAAKDNPLPVIAPPRVFGQVQLQSLAITEDGVRAGNGYFARVYVLLEVIGDYAFCDLRYSVNGGPMIDYVQNQRGRTVFFDVSDFSDVVIEVTAYSSFGRTGKSSKLTASHHVDYAGKSRPSDISGFSIDGNTFRCTQAPEVDVTGYMIRFHYGLNLSPADAAPLHDGQLSAMPATFQVLPSGVVTFFCTAIDAAGLESLNPGIIVKNLGDPALENVVEEFDFKAAVWPGTVVDGSNVGGDLEAGDTTLFYGPDSALFYSIGGDPFYGVSVFKTMVYETDGFYFPIEWADSAMVLEHQLEGEGITVEFRRGNDEVFYGAGGDAFYGTGGDAFYGDPGEYRIFTGTATYDPGLYQLRVTTNGGPVKGAIRALSVVIDVPDVRESINDLDVPAGGIRLALTKPFRAVKNVQLTLELAAGTAVSAKVIDKNLALGPLIEAIDSAGASVGGRVDAHITGY